MTLKERCLFLWRSMGFDRRLALFLMALMPVTHQGCEVSGSGFRITGVYEAAKSGYRLHVVSAGFVKQGDDLAESAFAAVAFSPAGNANARCERITLTENPGEWIKLDCKDLEIASADMNWKTSGELLTAILARAGYENLAPDEVQGSARVIMCALSGPKGVILKGQINSLQVLQVDITYGYALTRSDPPSTWIDLAEYPVCE